MPAEICWRCHANGVPIGQFDVPNWTEEPFFWICSECDHRWHHHSEGTALHEQADPYVKRGGSRYEL